MGPGAAATVVGRNFLERRIAGEIDALLVAARPAASATVSEEDPQRLPELPAGAEEATIRLVHGRPRVVSVAATGELWRFASMT